MKPILFNTEMVKAILEGRKTVTRRVVKLPKRVQEQENGLYTLFTEGTVYENFCIDQIVDYISPYQVNDILYVRETWHRYIKRVGKGESCRLQEFYGYKASIANSEDANTPWKPSIHMPKEAARLFLRVTDIRVERLQDMTLTDFLKEGIQVRPEAFNDPENAYYTAKEYFRSLWNSTLGRKDTPEWYAYNWSGNPYVWVIEFEVIDRQQLGGISN